MTKGAIMGLCVALLMIVAVAGVAVQTSSAAPTMYKMPWVIVVQASASIQDAIVAASPGDTVLLMPGTYDGSVCIDKSITLMGSGEKATTIVGDVHVKASNVKVGQFTVKGGFLSVSEVSCVAIDHVTTYFTNNVGDGIGIWKSSKVSIMFCTVDGSMAHSGMGWRDRGISISSCSYVDLICNKVSHVTLMAIWINFSDHIFGVGNTNTDCGSSIGTNSSPFVFVR
jgi:nitrous oxidase accessory protein NosD